MVLSDTVLIAMITAIPPTLVALVGLLVSIMNHRKIEVVQIATDGMKDQLMKVTRSDALQEGHAQGVADEKAKPT